jgi:hypothetical protein
VGDIESEQFHNDLEIEISNLDEPEIAASSSRPLLLFRKPRFSPRQRKLYLLLLNGLVILAVVLLLANTTSVRELVSSVFIHPTPSPTATLAPGVDLFYIRASPPLGAALRRWASDSPPHHEHRSPTALCARATPARLAG